MVSPFAATPVRGLADDITKMTSPDLVQVSNKQDEGGGGGGDEPPKAERPEITAVTTKYDLEDALKRQSEGKAAAEKARQAAIYEEYKPQLTQRFEQFQPPKDTFQGLASLGMMMMAVGSMGGKKGLTSATGAMNAIAGMATGYQQGRKEEFDRQKAIFDENFRIMKENQAQIEKEFQYALKYAKTDLTGATNKMIQSRAAAGDNVTKESIEKNGLIPTYNEHRQATAKYNEVAEKQKAYRDAQVALLRKQLDQKEAEEKIKTQKAAAEAEQLGVKTQKEKLDVQLKELELQQGGKAPKASDYIWVKEDGKTTRMTLKEIAEGKAQGRNIEYSAPPKESAGGMNARFTDNVLRSGNEALRSYEIWDKMGANVGQGIFGAVTNKGTISSAITSSLANRMTPEEMRNYNTIASDLSYEIATAMSGGYRVNQTTIDKIERAIKAVDGDSYQNVAFKFATGIAKLRSAIEPTTTYSDQQKKTKEDILKRSEKYVTPEDVLDKVGKKRVLRSDLHAEAKSRNIQPKEAERLATKQGYIIYDPFPSRTEVEQSIIKDKSDE